MRSFKRNVVVCLARSLNICAVLALAPLLGSCGSSGNSNKNNTASDAGADADAAATDSAADAIADSAADAPTDAAAGLGFTPSNVDPKTLDFTGVGDVDINSPTCYINSEMEDACFDPSLVKYTLITQSNQIKVGIYVAHSWRIEPNAILHVKGSFPIILVATDSMNILGGLVANATSDQAVAGGYTSTLNATKGLGPGGGGAGSATNAAGGGSYCGIGGKGGLIPPGANAAGGTAYGTPEIIPLEGGSQGGCGEKTNGGAGGGAVQLVAGNTMSILSGAFINVGGGAGNWAGGGGGSGGALLIEAPTVTVAGVLAANGGGGQSGSGGTPATDATANDQPAKGSGTAASSAGGGDGSAGTTINGSDGADGTTTIYPGGGGGGAGRIRINTKSGSATLTGATLSPGATTSCVTQGTLNP